MYKIKGKFFSSQKSSQKNIKAMLCAAVCAVCVGLVSCMTCFFAQCEGIRTQVLRLHVLANSDTEEDQSLKLAVRDRILCEGAELFTEVTTLSEAESKAVRELQRLQKAAEQVIKELGYNYIVSVELEKAAFETREYDGVTLPAGRYDAVRVVIGSGAGHNWWCVMFPPMCVSAASGNTQDEAQISDVLKDDELDIACNAPRYKIKLKAVELYEQISEKIQSIGKTDSK